ncbi:MAG: hypothetical protein U1E76_25575 [Planctomycetota bacterium]
MVVRRRGATHVNVIWVVALLVLVIFAAGGVWVVNQDRNTMENDLKAAKTDKDRLEKDAEAARKQLLEQSNLVGFKSTTATGGSNQEDIKARIAKLQEAHKEFMPSDPATTTLEVCVAKLEEAFGGLKNQLTEKEQSLKAAQSSREEGERNLAGVTADKDKKISELEQNLADERERGANQKNQDEQRVAQLQSQVDEAQTKVTEAQNAMRTAEEKQKNQIMIKDARIGELNSKLKLTREPEKADGKIISRAEKSDTAFIDIGAKDMLRRGTRFEVLTYGKGGVPHRKGMVEVKNVNADDAEVTVIEQLNALDPIVAGDQVAAPYFDRDMKKRFVFLGRFPANASKNFVKQRLENVGAQVDDAVTPATDYLVYGEKDITENAPDLTDTEDYKKALEYGVQMISINDMLSFIKY